MNLCTNIAWVCHYWHGLCTLLKSRACLRYKSNCHFGWEAPNQYQESLYSMADVKVFSLRMTYVTYRSIIILHSFCWLMLQYCIMLWLQILFIWWFIWSFIHFFNYYLLFKFYLWIQLEFWESLIYLFFMTLKEKKMPLILNDVRCFQMKHWWSESNRIDVNTNVLKLSYIMQVNRFSLKSYIPILFLCYGTTVCLLGLISAWL